LIYGVSITTGAINDFEQSLELATKMVLYYGMGSSIIYSSMSDKYKQKVDEDVMNLINTAYSKEKAEIILFENYLHNVFYLKDCKLTYGSNASVLHSLFLKSMQNLLISTSFNLLINRMSLKYDYNAKSFEVKTNVIDVFSF
jgi:hypothetical protein